MTGKHPDEQRCMINYDQLCIFKFFVTLLLFSPIVIILLDGFVFLLKLPSSICSEDHMEMS